MKERDIVRNRTTQREGVVVVTIRTKRADGLYSVIYDGSTAAEVVTDVREFEVIGQYAALADPVGCGAGRREQCCKFLTLSPGEGFYCERFGALHWVLVLAEMTSKRIPYQPFPDCKLTN